MRCLRFKNIGDSQSVLNHFIAEKCNRIHYEQNGPIVSPGYLDQNLYAPNLDCLIQIKLDENQLKIGLFFLTFELEDSTNCVSDYLRIDSNEKLCGRQLPNPYFKNSNSLDMYFHTNDQLQGKIKMSPSENRTINKLLNSLYDTFEIWSVVL